MGNCGYFQCRVGGCPIGGRATGSGSWWVIYKTCYPLNISFHHRIWLQKSLIAFLFDDSLCDSVLQAMRKNCRKEVCGMCSSWLLRAWKLPFPCTKLSTHVRNLFDNSASFLICRKIFLLDEWGAFRPYFDLTAISLLYFRNFFESKPLPFRRRCLACLWNEWRNTTSLSWVPYKVWNPFHIFISSALWLWLLIIV